MPGIARKSRSSDRNAPATNQAAEMKPGVWSFSTRSLSTVFGACTDGCVGAGGVEDLHRARGVVAADIDEGACRCFAQLINDVCAIFLVGFVARRAEAGVGGFA